MGWLWTDKPAQEPARAQAPTQPQPAKDSPPTAPVHASQPASTTPPSRAPTRDELAELELQSFLTELSTTSEPWSGPTPAQTRAANPSTSSPSTKPTATTTTPAAVISPIAPSNIYPTTMSCRAAFDAAYYCQLPGGQFINVYRHGNLKDCSQLWEGFWFCMRTNRGFMSDAERAGRIKEHYWKLDQKYREGPSSEDVWTMRDEPVQGAFEGDLRDVE